MAVAKIHAFVVKALLIKHVLDGLERIVITAPRSLGKSTNVDVITTFVSILWTTSMPHKATSIPTFKLNREYTDFVNDSYGTCPMLHVDFKNDDSVRNYGDPSKL